MRLYRASTSMPARAHRSDLNACVVGRGDDLNRDEPRRPVALGLGCGAPTTTSVENLHAGNELRVGADLAEHGVGDHEIELIFQPDHELSEVERVGGEVRR